MITDKRKKLVAIVAHCILNQNTVVKPLASHPGAVVDLVKLLIEKGYGILQLPCPEAIYLGMRRWWMSREQYDTSHYRAFSRRILEQYVTLLEELVKDGVRYIVIGVKGSPSCATQVSTSNMHWMGEPRIDFYPSSEKISAPGIFMEMFLDMIKERGLPDPMAIIDVDHEEIATKGLSIDVINVINQCSQSQTRD